MTFFSLSYFHHVKRGFLVGSLWEGLKQPFIGNSYLDGFFAYDVQFWVHGGPNIFFAEIIC